MLPLISYEMIRQRNEERRQRSLSRYWWRYVRSDEMVPEPALIAEPVRDADVVELVFGTHCGVEEPIGA